jgi:hypothetical protein
MYNAISRTSPIFYWYGTVQPFHSSSGFEENFNIFEGNFGQNKETKDIYIL